MLNKKIKDKIIKKFRIHQGDTGSTPIQIAILTEEIRQLTDHLKTHKKDFSSRRGLLKKVAERRRLLVYLNREEPEQYEKIVKELKLKMAQLLAQEQKKEIVEETEIKVQSEQKSETDKKPQEIQT